MPMVPHLPVCLPRHATQPLRPHRRQRGSSLLEALIAFLVVSLGMLAVARVQSTMRLQSDIARQRSEAVRLAQEDIETLRGFSVLASRPGAMAFDQIVDATRTVDAGAGYATNTRYSVTRQVDAGAWPQARSVAVTVGWTDRHGEPQQLGLQSMIAGNDPAFSAALSLVNSANPVTGPLARSIRIPLAAKDLGDGRSAFKPVGDGSVALLFDNLSGAVIGRCSAVPAGTPSRTLQASDLLGCDTHVGQLLSGVVRFSSVSPPDAAHPDGAALALSISPALGAQVVTAPWCASEAMKTVTYTTAGSFHIEPVPVAASPAAFGLPGWSDTGERFVAYHCAVYAGVAGWSGRVTLVASGWHIGTGPGDHRVCRYTSDLDGSDAIDANIEHPADYAAVGGALAAQNFLVIRGTDTCPTGHAVMIAGAPSDVVADLGTVQHQP